MPPEHPEEGSAEYWLRRARSVLAIAATPHPPKEALPADLCYCAQQAAEKALKGVCEHLAIQPPLTHDIKLLLDLIGARTRVPAGVHAAEPLTRYAVADRYLGALDSVTGDDLHEAVDLARDVVEWASSIVEPNAD